MATLPYSSSGFGGVLVASGDPARRDQIISTLHTTRWPVVAAHGGADALGKLETTECDLLLLDRCLPDLDPDEFIRMVKQQYPGVEVVELGSAGATKLSGPPARALPIENELLHVVSEVETEVKEHEAPIPDIPIQAEPLPGMVGRAESMQKVYKMVRLVAPRTTTVLITGPTGSGKELVARAVHKLSVRAARPFIAINCTAIPEALLESELFGYARGAFTGAVQSRVGRIQAAQGGTLFLDEIGDMPVGLQAKLLRFLERGELQRLGSAEISHVDVRVVAATNAELLEKVRDGSFRQDLYFRLSVFPIELPGLAEHKSDIRELVARTLEELGGEVELELSEGTIRVLEAHSWPGNVRELRHVLERAVIMADGGKSIGPEHVHFSSIPREKSERY